MARMLLLVPRQWGESLSKLVATADASATALTKLAN